MIQINDTFTDTDATDLNAHTPDTDREGGGYTETAGDWEILLNQLYTTSVVDARARIDAGIYDGRFKIDLMVGLATGAAYMVFRSNAAVTNYWRAGLDDNTQQVYLYSVTAGVATLTAAKDFTQDEATTYELKVVCVGDDIEVYVDDVLMISHTSELYNTQEYVGFYANSNTAARFDDFVADTRPTCLYCTTTDVKNRLGEQYTSGTKYDAMLEEAIEEASRLVDLELGWQDCHFAASDLAAVIRYYDGVSGDEMEVDRFLNDAAVVIEVDETATGVYVTWVQGTDYELWPYNEQYWTKILVKYGASKVFAQGQRLVRVTGRLGGYATPPAPIRKAAIICVAKAYKRGMQMYQDTGAIEELGQLKYVLAIDPEVEEILKVVPRRVPWG